MRNNNDMHIDHELHPMNHAVYTEEKPKGFPRETIEQMMAQFLSKKKNKIKKVKRGKSGFSQSRMEAGWGFSGGLR